MTKAPGKNPTVAADAVAAKLNKYFKKRVIAKVSEVPNVYYLRRPSGILDLDIDCGGGLPSATVHCLSGPDGAGKSLLLYRYMAQQQKYYRENCWLQLAAIEHPVDHFRLRKVGLKIAIPKTRIDQEQETRRKLGNPLYTKAEIAELQTGVGRFDLIHGSDMEDTCDTVLHTLRQCQKYGTYPNIIGIDSLTAMTPRDCMGKDMDENAKRAAHAGKTTEFLAKYMPLVTQLNNEPAQTTLILTQQVRSNDAKASASPFMQKFLPDFKVAGAWAMKHGKCFDILVTHGKKTREKGKEEEGEKGAKEDTSKKKVISRLMKWEFLKAKAGAWEGIFGEADMNPRNIDPFDDTRNLIVGGLKHGVLREVRGMIHWEDKGLKFHIDAFMDRLDQDVDTEYMLRQAILTKVGITCAYYV